MSAKAGEAAASSTLKQLPYFRKNPYWKSQRKERRHEKLYHRNLSRARGATDPHGKPIFTPYTWNVVRGDLVQVTSTSRKRDKLNKGAYLRNEDGSYVAQDWLGQKGIVLKVLRKQEKVIVQGVNMRTRVAQPTQQSTGHFLKVESPIPYSQVSLIDPSTGEPVQGGIRRVKKGPAMKGRERVAGSTKAIIPTPDALKMSRVRVANAMTDTAAQDVLEVTYVKPQLRPSVAKKNPDGSIVKDELGRVELEEESSELRAARIKF